MTGFMKGAMILTVAGLLVKVIGAISKVIVARILGGEGVGLYQMAYSLYQLIISIGAAGLPVAISIMIARQHQLLWYQPQVNSSYERNHNICQRHRNGQHN